MCLDVGVDIISVQTCVRVCVLGMDGIKSQGGNLRRGLEFGKAFVGVTQHIVPRASDIDVYLVLQHDQASTTPHTLPAYVFMTIDHRLESLYVATPPPIHPDVPDAPMCVTCDSTRLTSVGRLVLSC